MIKSYLKLIFFFALAIILIVLLHYFTILDLDLIVFSISFIVITFLIIYAFIQGKKSFEED